jgi:hypothetical protein
MQRRSQGVAAQYPIEVGMLLERLYGVVLDSSGLIVALNCQGCSGGKVKKKDRFSKPMRGVEN